MFQDSRQCGCGRIEKPTVSAEFISEMIQEELMRCRCLEGFLFEKIDDGKYKVSDFTFAITFNELCIVNELVLAVEHS